MTKPLARILMRLQNAVPLLSSVAPRPDRTPQMPTHREKCHESGLEPSVARNQGSKPLRR
jgi:hypothetical protein